MMEISKRVQNLSLIEEQFSHENIRSGQEEDKECGRYESPPAKTGKWEMPPELEFTPIPGYRMVDQTTYNMLMAEK